LFVLAAKRAPELQAGVRRNDFIRHGGRHRCDRGSGHLPTEC
jgi:hypothetical protein